MNTIDTFCLQFCHQQQPPRQIRAIYLCSDVDDETRAKLDAANDRGHARYIAAMEKDANADSVQIYLKLKTF